MKYTIELTKGDTVELTGDELKDVVVEMCAFLKRQYKVCRKIYEKEDSNVFWGKADAYENAWNHLGALMREIKVSR
jgi:ASC-1-like (ASCH) protein